MESNEALGYNLNQVNVEATCPVIDNRNDVIVESTCPVNNEIINVNLETNCNSVDSGNHDLDEAKKNFYELVYANEDFKKKTKRK